MNKQVTSLSTGAVSTIFLPGRATAYLSISNVGANAINYVIDGGTLRGGGVDPTTGATGIGEPLAAGSAVRYNIQPGDSSIIFGIRAIMQTGTTTLNLCTNDLGGTFPTT